MRIPGCFVWTLIVVLAAAALALAGEGSDTVEIRVRILHARTGKPWKGIPVILYGDRDLGPGLRKENVVFEIDAKTKRTGSLTSFCPHPYRQG